MCKECNEAVEKLKKDIQLKAKTADIYIRRHPYESIGMAVAVIGVSAFFAGYILGKK